MLCDVTITDVIPEYTTYVDGPLITAAPTTQLARTVIPPEGSGDTLTVNLPGQGHGRSAVVNYRSRQRWFDTDTNTTTNPKGL